MRGYGLQFFFIFSCLKLIGQDVESMGVFGGVNIPLTLDQGLVKDPRFFGRFTLRSTPFGFAYGYDKLGYGFVTTPSFTQIGQKFTIKNTTGGEIGLRDIKMSYVSVPVALKLHMTDMAFFRLSLVAAINFNYLIKGSETISHESGKLKYPAGVVVPSEPGYVKAYDGVFVPEVSNLEYVSKNQFKALQIFAALGFRSDYDFNEDWSLNFDGRANFGVFEPRKNAYINSLKAPVDAPDLYGQRRELYFSFAVGISRIVQIKESYKTKRSATPQRNNKKR